jgi:hypothetical protein
MPHVFHVSLCIITVIKSRRMRWEGHVVRAGDMRNIYRLLAGKLERRDHLEDLGVDGKIILDWILGK